MLCIVRAILYEVFSSIREGMESEEMTDRHLKSSEKLFLRFTKLILDEDHISRTPNIHHVGIIGRVERGSLTLSQNRA